MPAGRRRAGQFEEDRVAEMLAPWNKVPINSWRGAIETPAQAVGSVETADRRCNPMRGIGRVCEGDADRLRTRDEGQMIVLIGLAGAAGI